MTKISPEKANVREWLAVLDEASRGKNYPALFKRVHDLVAVPSRSRKAVSLHKINKYTEDGAVVVVPAKILSTGKLEHKVTIAALEYSSGALSAIKSSGSRAIGIKDLVGQKKISLLV